MLSNYPDVDELPRKIKILTITGNKPMRNVQIVIEDHEQKTYNLGFYGSSDNETTEVKLSIQSKKSIALGIDCSQILATTSRKNIYFMEADDWLTHFLNYGSATIEVMRCQSLVWNGALKCSPIQNCYCFIVNTNSDLLKLLELTEKTYCFARLTINTSIICKENEYKLSRSYDEDNRTEMQMIDSRELLRVSTKQLKIKTTFISNDAVFDYLNHWADGKLPDLERLSCSIFDIYSIERLLNSIKSKVPDIQRIGKNEANNSSNEVRMNFRLAGLTANDTCTSFLLKQSKNPKVTAIICFHSVETTK